MPTATAPTLPRPAWTAPLVGMAMACVYVATAARSVQGFDCGELTAMAHDWGVAHPPGFATFALLAGSFAHLSPLGTAHTLALLSAAAGALACGLLCATLLRLGVRAGIAATVACTWGLLAPSWTLHTEQEVFAVAHLAVALLVWLAVREGQEGQRGGVFWLGLCSAAGAAVHTTVVLAAPLVAVALWWPSRPVDSRQRRSRSARFALGVAIGLLPLLYLPLASLHGGAPSWGHIDSVEALVRHILRSDYGILSLALDGQGARGEVNGRYVTHLLGDGVLLLPVAIAIGLATLSKPEAAHRRLSGAVALCFLTASVLFLGAFATPDNAWWHEVTQRFFPAVDLYGCVLAGVGLERLAMAVPAARMKAARAGLLLWLALVAGLALPSGPCWGRDSLATYADTVLDGLEPHALLLGQGDDDASAFWEAQIARGRRPDVGFVLPALLPWPWYAATTRRVASGFVQPAHLAGIRLLLEHGRRVGRPVYLTGALPAGLRTRYATVPAGLAVRVLPAGSPLPEPVALQAELEALLLRHPRAPSPDWQRRHATERAIAERYAAPWLALAGAWRSLGLGGEATKCLGRARAALAAQATVGQGLD